MVGGASASGAPSGETSRPAGTVEPTADEPTLHLLRRFIGLVDSRRRIALFVVLSVVSGGAEALAILLVVSGASGIAAGGSEIPLDVGPIDVTLTLSGVLAASVAVTVLLVAAKLSAAALAARLGSTTLHAARERLVHGLLGATWEVQASVTSSRFQDLLSVQSLRMADLVVLLSNFLAAVIAFVAMVATALLVQPVTAIALVVLGGILGGVFRPLTRRIRQISMGHLERHQDYVGHVANLFGVLPEIRIYGVREEAVARHDADSRSVAEWYRRMRLMGAFQPAMYLGIVMLMLVAGLALISATGMDDIALVGATVLVLLRGLRYSQQAQTRWQNAVEILPYLTNIDAMVDAWRSSDRTWGPRPLEQVRELEFRDVQYVYPTGEPGLRGVDLRVTPGRIVGLAGASGAGKSTLAQVLLGLRAPTAGSYLVDGVESTSFDQSSWFSRFAYVAQQPVLLDDDVRENVRFLRTGLDDEAVARALSAAAMDADIASWSEGAGRSVGAAGSEVSGGQRQRIAIARALVGEPDVLVLDEPTSALDPEAERVIRETLQRLRGKLTVVLIAHRESTLEVCDLVVRMQDGRIHSVAAKDPSTG